MKKLLYISLLCCLFHLGIAQPQLSTKQEIAGITFYQDIKKPTTFYYAPTQLRLGKESTGEPKFKMLATRYTGNSVSGDRGENRFLNIVQFTVQMERINARQLREAKQQLGTNANIRTIPIRNIEAYLVAPVGQEYQRLGGTGSFSADGTAGQTTRRVFWTERTFTLRVDNNDAQILWDQLEDGKISLSLNYAFYADMIVEQAAVVEVDGDSTLVADLENQLEGLTEIDSTAIPQAIVTDAFPIRIDQSEYPNLLQKLDINEEGIPVNYPAVEIRCYDFANDLRPELSKKIVELKAIGINGNAVALDPISFSRFQPDLHTHQLKFSRPVLMKYPLQYRVVEYPNEGERKVSGWQEKADWLGLLDITTDIDDQRHERRSIEFEFLTSKDNHSNQQLFLEYRYQGKPKTQTLDVNLENNLVQITLLIDKESSIYYSNVRPEGQRFSRVSRRKVVPADNYVLIKEQ